MQSNDIIVSRKDFDINQTLKCGQVFRYKILENHAEVFSCNHKAILYNKSKDEIVIENENKEYFENYFDLDTDYSLIKKNLEPLPLMKESVKFGYGIRILKQDIVETILSFIISANNNIPRIQGILNKLMPNDHYPSLEELASLTQNDFKAMGCGYRANYLFDTIRKLNLQSVDLTQPYKLNGLDANKFLCENFLGVGPKVADCILLFAYHKSDVFPVDTWVKKIYLDLFPTLDSPSAIRKKLIQTYGELSGYAQQYLFYNKRSGQKE